MVTAQKKQETHEELADEVDNDSGSHDISSPTTFAVPD